VLFSSLLTISTTGVITRLEYDNYDNNVALTAIVSFDGESLQQEFSVTIKGTGNDSSNPPVRTAKVSVIDPNSTSGNGMFFAQQLINIEAGETAFTILQKTGLVLDVSESSQYAGAYVKGINGLSEFDEGPENGWMYSVNGIFPNYSSSLYVLKEGDVVAWLYTRDLGKDIGASYVTNPFNPGGVESTTVEEVIINATVTNGAAKAVADTDDIKKAINAAVEIAAKDGSTPEVKISIKNDNNAASLATTIKADAIRAIGQADKAQLTIQSSLGTLTLDNPTLNGLVSGVSGNPDIVINIAKVDNGALTEGQRAIVGDNPVFDLSITVMGETVHDFNGGVTVFLPYTGTDANDKTVYYLDTDNNALHILGVRYDAIRKGFVFTTRHFSLFFISTRIND